MLASHLLHRTNGSTSTSSSSPDARSRSVEAVFDAAAARFGRTSEPAVLQALAASGVGCAQQLEQMTEADWGSVGVSLGLKTAVKAELANPTDDGTVTVHGSDGSTGGRDLDGIDMLTRQFLLIPSADGEEAKPLGRWSAFFLSLTATPAADRQNLLLALCELTALVSGLFQPISLDFRRQFNAGDAITATNRTQDKGWDVSPTLADGMDATATFLFLCNIWVTFLSVVCGMMIASGGWHLDDQFCRGAIGLLAALLFYLFLHCIVWPLIFLAMWQAFTDASSPYPLIGCLVLFLVFYQFVFTLFLSFVISNMPLEMYHMPRWLKEDIKHFLPWLKRRVSDQALRGPAERRAARLRMQMGLRHDWLGSPRRSPVGGGATQEPRAGGSYGTTTAMGTTYARTQVVPSLVSQ